MSCRFCLNPESKCECKSIASIKKKEGFYFDSKELRYKRLNELPFFTGKNIIVCDLHKTLNLLEPELGNEIIKRLKRNYIFICLSWVGLQSETRLFTQKEIVLYDTDYKYICFNRGSDKDKPGNKGNFVLKMVENGNNVVFLDDAEDHCVACESIKGCKVYRITSKSYLIDVLSSLF